MLFERGKSLVRIFRIRSRVYQHNAVCRNSLLEGSVEQWRRGIGQRRAQLGKIGELLGRRRAAGRQHDKWQQPQAAADSAADERCSHRPPLLNRSNRLTLMPGLQLSSVTPLLKKRGARLEMH